MPTDHPDGTRPIVISRADIQTPIDIQHQTTNVDTDFKAQSVGVYAQPEWAALKEVDKNINGLLNDQAFGGQLVVSHPVPATKTFYICGISGASEANLVADADLPQHLRLDLYNLTADKHLLYGGGDGGCVIPLAKPMVIEGGDTIELLVMNRANHNTNLKGSIWGYEI